MKSLRYNILFILLLITTTTSAYATPAIRWINQPEGNQKTGTMIRFEFLCDTEVPNPYDSDSIQIVLNIWNQKKDTLSLTGFHYTPYMKKGNEWVQNGHAIWQVRHTPAEAGSYQYQVRIHHKSGSVKSDIQLFEVVDHEWDGFVKASRNHRYFELHSGKTFFPSGINLAHPPHNGKALDYDYFFKKMKENKMNFTRIWLTPQWGKHAIALEWTDKQYPSQKGLLGLRRINSEMAYRLDRIMESAQEHGIYVMLCMLDERELEAEKDWKENPYNTAKGGPVSDPMDFFSNVEAKSAFKNRLHYLISRYSAYPNLFAWEFWNEFDHHRLIPDWDSHRERVGEWHREMSRYIKMNDPYQHVVTTSVVGSRTDRLIWDYPDIDMVQAHSYVGKDHLAERSDDLYRLFMKEYPEKPFFIGEMGTDWRGFNKINDAEKTGLHNGLWATAMGGHSGTGMWWWWYETDEADLWSEWKNLAIFTEGINRPASINDSVSSNHHQLKGKYTVSEGQVWIWCYNLRHNWLNVKNGIEAKSLENIKITVQHIPPGDYELLEFRNGKFANLKNIYSEGTAEIVIPRVEADVALKLLPLRK
jgi:hypothetical protein